MIDTFELEVYILKRHIIIFQHKLAAERFYWLYALVATPTTFVG